MIHTNSLVTLLSALVRTFSLTDRWYSLLIRVLGFRIPGYIVSPWTRGGKVFTEHSDHSSHIRFVEQWAAAQGYSGVKSAELTPWRRSHISDLINAFDFENVSKIQFMSLSLSRAILVAAQVV